LEGLAGVVGVHTTRGQELSGVLRDGGCVAVGVVADGTVVVEAFLVPEQGEAGGEESHGDGEGVDGGALRDESGVDQLTIEVGAVGVQAVNGCIKTKKKPEKMSSLY
jgi:hypothetical protein